MSQHSRFPSIALNALLVVALLNLALLLFLRGMGATKGEPSSPAVRVPTPAEKAEKRFAAAGLQAARMGVAADADRPSVSVPFSKAELAANQLFLRTTDGSRAVLVDADGRITENERLLAELETSGRFVRTPEHAVLYADGVPVLTELQALDAFWLVPSGATPEVRLETSTPIAFEDGFMRKRLLEGGWRATRGGWGLYQRGGGMPSSDGQMANATFQRAVNPFTVRGTDYPVLSVGDEAWRQYLGEACFRFGLPQTDEVIDCDTLPVKTDLLVSQGRDDGHQVAFGWHGESGRFALLQRAAPDEDWRVSALYEGPRPPLTNWVRIGIAVRAGCVAEGYLDGVRVVSAELDRYLAGPFHVMGGRELAEFDDVSVFSLPVGENDEAPYFLKSRNFAGKREKHDPDEFFEWTLATEAFVERRGRTDGERRATILTKRPLMGTFRYESVPDDDDAGLLPEGDYCFTFIPRPHGTVDVPPVDAPDARSLRVRQRAGKWQRLDETGAPLEGAAAVPTLRFARVWDDSPEVEWIHSDGRRTSLFSLPTRQVHLAIARVSSDGYGVPMPRPEHHRFTSANLVNELFEGAPVDWSWIDGAFRMDTRWACQNRWNFMACGSVETPFMVSKKRFAGDQEHQYFLSVRPVMPWDAGDTTWNYEPSQDEGWHTLKRNRGWYVRHDLNFAFCSDGKNPLSGYAVLFAGEDNSRTMLMRKGEVVAETQAPENLFPTKRSHLAVHWKWWAFNVRKYGGTIIVEYNGHQILSYQDPEPLDGGHIGFWTVRNGFTTARAVSLAERVTDHPHHLYVEPDIASRWQPLLRDSVHLAAAAPPFDVRVSANRGGGHFAVRTTFEQPVDLNKTPILDLPLEIGPGARINLFVETNRGDAIVRIAAPLSGMKGLLTPAFERGECFQLDPWSEERVRRRHTVVEAQPVDGRLRVDLGNALASRRGGNATRCHVRSLTLGNASNDGYLKAGRGGNEAGTWYQVGKPTWKTR